LASKNYCAKTRRGPVQYIISFQDRCNGLETDRTTRQMTGFCTRKWRRINMNLSTIFTDGIIHHIWTWPNDDIVIVSR